MLIDVQAIDTKVDAGSAYRQWQDRARPFRRWTQREFFSWQVEELVSQNLASYGDADPFRRCTAEELGKGLFQFTPPPQDIDHAITQIKGTNHVNERWVNAREALRTASVLLDVEDGSSRLTTTACDARRQIALECRRGFDVWTGIIHAALFPHVLKGRAMNLVDSRIPQSGECLILYGNSPITLSFHSEEVRHSTFGAPSYGGILLP